MVVVSWVARPVVNVAYVISADADGPASRQEFGRRLLQHLAATAFGTDRIAIGAEPSGRPILLDPPKPAFISLTHSGQVVAAALARRPVGIDAEQLPRAPHHPRLVPRVCSPVEIDALDRLAPNERDEAFMRIWTRKEAYGKALGVGLDFRLRTVTVGPQGARVRGVTGRWVVTDVDLGPDIAAALVTQGRRPNIDIERVDPALVGLRGHRA